MPYLVKIGAIPENTSGVGSRGYHVYRRKRRVTTVWGHIEVRPRSQFYWAHTTQHQVRTFRTVRAAAAYVKTVLRRFLDGESYSRLPQGVKIRRHAKSARSTLKK